jgi:hypothetical protein
MPITLSSTPQTVEVPVAGPGGSNRLFVFSGIAEVNLKGTGGEWRRETLKVEINRSFSATQYQKGIAIASLAAISNKNEAVNAGWAIESVGVTRDSASGKPVLTARIAVRDNDGVLESIAYEVFVLAKL